MSRPKRYHRRGSLVWQRALRRLAGKGLTDARVAELLSGLTETALLRLDLAGWTVERAEDLAVPGANPWPWSEHSVRRCRRTMGLPANHPGPGRASARLRELRRSRQAEAGFWHLLPDADSGESGWDLWQSECRVLALLQQHGPMSRRDVIAALGGRPRGRHGWSVFAGLLASGLVEIVQGDGGSRFMLADDASRQETRRETGIDAKYG